MSERMDEWIDSKSILNGEMILVRDLRELLKKNAVITRGYAHDLVIDQGRINLPPGVKMWDQDLSKLYVSMIQAAELV